MKQETPLQQLFAKEVSRKEFLAIMLSGMTAVCGLSSIIHFLTGKKMGTSSQALTGNRSAGYNMGPYGG